MPTYWIPYWWLVKRPIGRGRRWRRKHYKTLSQEIKVNRIQKSRRMGRTMIKYCGKKIRQTSLTTNYYRPSLHVSSPPSPDSLSSRPLHASPSSRQTEPPTEPSRRKIMFTARQVILPIYVSTYWIPYWWLSKRPIGAGHRWRWKQNETLSQDEKANCIHKFTHDKKADGKNPDKWLWQAKKEKFTHYQLLSPLNS